MELFYKELKGSCGPLLSGFLSWSKESGNLSTVHEEPFVGPLDVTTNYYDLYLFYRPLLASSVSHHRLVQYHVSGFHLLLDFIFCIFVFVCPSVHSFCPSKNICSPVLRILRMIKKAFYKLVTIHNVSLSRPSACWDGLCLHITLIGVDR